MIASRCSGTVLPGGVQRLQRSQEDVHVGGILCQAEICSPNRQNNRAQRKGTGLLDVH